MGQVPKIQNSSGRTIIQHREFIGNVGPTTAFSLVAYELNPGLPATFPWLSSVAAAYAEYRWRGLVFTYKTTSSDLATGTNSSLGTVILATSYNIGESLPYSKAQLLNYEYTTSTKPSQSCVHGIECAKSQTAHNTLFVRDGPAPPNFDKRLSDIGTFFLAREGQQATGGDIGELYVSYEIELMKPRFNINNTELQDNWFIDTVGNGVYLYSTNASGIVWLAGADTTGQGLLTAVGNQVVYDGNLGCKLAYTGTTGALQITFPQVSGNRTFQITLVTDTGGTTVAAAAQFSATFANCAVAKRGSPTGALPVLPATGNDGVIGNRSLFFLGAVYIYEYDPLAIPTVTLTPSSIAVNAWPANTTASGWYTRLLINEIPNETIGY